MGQTQSRMARKGSSQLTWFREGTLYHLYPSRTRLSNDAAGIEQLADSIDRNGLLLPIFMHAIHSDRHEPVVGQSRYMSRRMLDEDQQEPWVLLDRTIRSHDGRY